MGLLCKIKKYLEVRYFQRDCTKILSSFPYIGRASSSSRNMVARYVKHAAAAHIESNLLKWATLYFHLILQFKQPFSNKCQAVKFFADSQP